MSLELRMERPARRPAAEEAPASGSCQSCPKQLTSASPSRVERISFLALGHPTPFPHCYFELSSLSPPPIAVTLTLRVPLQPVAFPPLTQSPAIPRTGQGLPPAGWAGSSREDLMGCTGDCTSKQSHLRAAQGRPSLSPGLLSERPLNLCLKSHAQGFSSHS